VGRGVAQDRFESGLNLAGAGQQAPSAVQYH
jgi:hypothetical protein